MVIMGCPGGKINMAAVSAKRAMNLVITKRNMILLTNSTNKLYLQTLLTNFALKPAFNIYV